MRSPTSSGNRSRRLFVAIDLPDVERAAMAAIVGGVPGARWVAAGQLHLTLRFLGATPPGDVARIIDAIAAVASDAFEIALSGTGTFPGPAAPESPRILWAGVAPQEPVRELARRIDLALGPDPESASRGFHPHITLARLGEPHGDELPQFLLAHRDLARPPWTVDRFALYESLPLVQSSDP
jgi:2'-5' RNA ligase